MRICHECGAKNSDGARFCQHCGRKLDTDGDRMPAEQTAPRRKSAPQGIGRLSLLQMIALGEAVCLAVVIAAFFVTGFTKYKSTYSCRKEYFLGHMCPKTGLPCMICLSSPEGNIMQEETVRGCDGADEDCRYYQLYSERNRRGEK